MYCLNYCCVSLFVAACFVWVHCNTFQSSWFVNRSCSSCLRGKPDCVNCCAIERCCKYAIYRLNIRSFSALQHFNKLELTAYDTVISLLMWLLDTTTVVLGLSVFHYTRISRINICIWRKVVFRQTSRWLNKPQVLSWFSQVYK